MKISIISGSHRLSGQSGKIARVIAQSFSESSLCDESYLLDLADNPLPLWDDSIWSGDDSWQQRLAPISEQLSSSDALVIIVPEWHGMVPSGLKNFFLMWGKGELAHKPALLVSVSSDDGGAYPIAELRMSSYKNNRICYLPEHLIIRKVESVFNSSADDNDAKAQAYFEGRLDYCLKQLLTYAQAFKQIRESDTTSLSTYRNGM
ncbi:MAG: NAD(P)H-dependent oxidoreductase [Pseudomonadales bacterium]|nr:NAD(P)H-dependent oxidoreductase [Pseudomonadales bacterium]